MVLRMKKFKRLSLEEREMILALLNQGLSNRKIAAQLGRASSTINREINRFPSKMEYSPSKAHGLFKKEEFKRGRKRLFDERPELFQEVMDNLIQRLSPEQISKKMKREHANEPLKWMSHETIYRFIYAQPRGTLKKVLTSFLRRKRRLRRDRSAIHARRGQIPNAISISERPKEVDSRQIPGHWEGDLIIGKNHKSALGTLVERTTRFLVLVPIKGKDSKSVVESFSNVFKEVDPEMRKTMTYDRGLEMAEHEELTKDTGVAVYFCDPNSPWQRGTNENTNGLIRDYFPKGTDFNKITLEEIKFVQNQMNERPRKVLDWDSPKERFKKLGEALKS